MVLNSLQPQIVFLGVKPRTIKHTFPGHFTCRTLSRSDYKREFRQNSTVSVSMVTLLRIDLAYCVAANGVRKDKNPGTG